MSEELRAQISMLMVLKESDELLEIWRTNDRVEWSDMAFEVIQEILKKRGVAIPEQNEPIYEYEEEEQEEKAQKDYFDFTEKELKIIDDEYPPDFYSPYEAFLTTKRIEWVAKAAIVFTIAYNIVRFPQSLAIVRNPNLTLTYILAILLATANSAIGIVLIYFPLKALAHILRILMEMEYTSRKGMWFDHWLSRDSKGSGSEASK